MYIKTPGSAYELYSPRVEYMYMHAWLDSDTKSHLLRGFS